MRFDEAADILKKMHDSMMERKEGGQSALLFGLYFSEEIKTMSMKDICRAADISESYATEMRRGVKIRPYVKLEDDIKEKLLMLR